MLNSFPQRAGNLDLLLRTFEEALKGFSTEILIAVSGKYTRGEVTGQNLTFAPSVAEFTNAARELVKLRAPLALPNGYEIPREPIMAKVERVRREYAGRPVLAEKIDYQEFRQRAQAKEYPEGSEFVGLLSCVFGPSHHKGEAA